MLISGLLPEAYAPCGSASLPTSRVIPALAAKGLSFAYEGQPEVLRDISLTVGNGEFLGVVGPNGGGKTTLLKMMLGLHKPLAGEINVFGGEPALMRGHVGYVPQFSTMRPDFPASVLDVALMGAARPGIRAGSWPTDKSSREKALRYLDILGLSGCARLPVGALSGGQGQRLLVARALMGRPGNGLEDPAEENTDFLLLMDEPTASIDPEGKLRFYEFINRLRGLTSLVVVSHDLDMAAYCFDRIVLVNGGLYQLPENSLKPRELTALPDATMRSLQAALPRTGKVPHGGPCLYQASGIGIDRPGRTGCHAYSQNGCLTRPGNAGGGGR